MSYAIEAAGWLAAAFTLAAFAMKTMVPLRIAGLGANICFVVYGALLGIYPMLVLHLILMPFNVFRLWQIRQQIRLSRLARQGSVSIDWLRHVMEPTDAAEGEYLFRKGDAPDHFYLIEDGRILIEELGITLGHGDVLGEIAFFTDARERTASARCITPCTVLRVDEAAFLRLFHQNPSFGVFMVRLIATRMNDRVGPGGATAEVQPQDAPARDGAPVH